MQGYEAREGEVAAAIAVIHLRADGTAALEILGAGETPTSAIDQELAFREEDPPLERWKTIGLLVASLASGAPRFQELASSTEPGEDAAKSQPLPAVREETANEEKPLPPQQSDSAEPNRGATAKERNRSEEAGRSGIVARAILATEVRRGLQGEGESASAPRAGFLLRGSIASTSHPWEVDVGGGFSRAFWQGPLTLEWSTFELGSTYRLVWREKDMALRFRGLALVERLTASVSGASGSDRSRSARTSFGVGGGAGLSYPYSGPWSLDIEGVGLSLNGSTGVEVDGVRVGKVPSANVRASVGLGYRF